MQTFWRLNIRFGRNGLRLTRRRADQAVNDFMDRVRRVNADDRFQVRVAKAIAFGGYATTHDLIQDVEIGVELAPKRGSTTSAEEIATILQFLNTEGETVKVLPLTSWMPVMSGRVLLDSSL